MLRKDYHGKIIQHCRIILVKGEYYGLIIRCLDICDILIIAGNACTQSFILCKLFVSIYNIFSIKSFSVMPLHTITKFKSISIGIFIKGIALCKILYRFSICIIFHQTGKNKIRKLIMIVQKRIDRTFRLSCINQCFVFFCCKCSYCSPCYSSCTYCCHCRKRYCCTFLSVTVPCSLFVFLIFPYFRTGYPHFVWLYPYPVRYRHHSTYHFPSEIAVFIIHFASYKASHIGNTHQSNHQKNSRYHDHPPGIHDQCFIS